MKYTITPECNDEVQCSNARCSEQGRCICESGYSKDWRNLRICSPTTCHIILTNNEHADSLGPYMVGDVVTVTCTDGYHVMGRGEETEQVLECLETGYFDNVLQSCIGKQLLSIILIIALRNLRIWF